MIDNVKVDRCIGKVNVARECTDRQTNGRLRGNYVTGFAIQDVTEVTLNEAVAIAAVCPPIARAAVLAVAVVASIAAAVKARVLAVATEVAWLMDSSSRLSTLIKVWWDASVMASYNYIDETKPFNVSYRIITYHGSQLRIITRDKYAFKREVDNIKLRGNYDCPELAMEGIELALENSKPNSFIYVFTDAGAKDYYKFERVKSLSLKKSSQVTFLLTGLCKGGTKAPDYVAYEKLSEATSGQIFNIEKDDIDKVIDYIIQSIKHKRTTLRKKTIPSSDKTKNVTFAVDSKIWDVMVSVSADSPRYRIFGADHKELAVEIITATKRTSIGKLKTKPGIYTIVLNDDISSSPKSVVVTGSTSVTFQHGFSTFIPSSIEETSKQPIPDQQSFLLIELENIDRDVLLKMVEFRDENDNYINEIPLQIVNKEQQFYTTGAFYPPAVTFKILVHGYLPSNEKITRSSPTTVEYQKPDLVAETVKNLAPKVTIVQGVTLNAEYKKPLNIHCKVMAYPKPDVFWLDEKGALLPSTVTAVDLPYDYMSILHLAKVEANDTVTCTAKNTIGQDKVSAKIQIKSFFNVLEYPSDMTIEYKTTKQLKLNIESVPDVNIVWYKHGEEIRRNSEYFSISPDNSTLTIKNMQPEVRGNYTVKASNGVHAKQFYFKIHISGAEPPRIDTSTSSLYHVENGSSVDIPCRITHGKPEPKFQWFYDENYTDVFQLLQQRDDSSKESKFHIEKVNPKVAGAYRCLAYNDFGTDFRDMDLFVEYPPVVKIDETHRVLRAGELIKIICLVDGIPNPTVRWLIDGVEINATYKYNIYKDNTLSFRGSVDDKGVYTCEASNPLGKMHKDVRIDIFVPVNIESPKQSIIELKLGDPLILPCNADGFPTPNINWMFFSKNTKIAPKSIRMDNITNSVVIERAQISDEGLYTCVANNTKSLSNITYEVNVKAPPTIVNTLRDKTIEAVKGDLVLRLPCIVEGNPEPTVTWTFENGLKIVTGTEWFDVNEDGTLIINNVDENDAGGYICKAENSLGSSFENYKVVVLDSPNPPVNNPILMLEEGKSYRVDCRISQKSDLIRWFKDGRFIKYGDLILRNVKTGDSGVYSCRVSNFMDSHSAHYHVTVGSKPTFTTDENTDIDFIENYVAPLSCNARGEPKPKIEWLKNNQLIEETSMTHILFMKTSDIGQYSCRVSNNFGTISRVFNIINAKDNILDIGENSELLSSEKTNLPFYRSADSLFKAAHYYSKNIIPREG